MTWLITIARNLSIDGLRARKTATGAGLDEASELPSAAPGPETLAIAASDQVQIVGCMQELDPDKADAVRRPTLKVKHIKSWQRVTTCRLIRSGRGCAAV